jgi:hypothetical protein
LGSRLHLGFAGNWPSYRGKKAKKISPLKPGQGW